MLSPELSLMLYGMVIIKPVCSPPLARGSVAGLLMLALAQSAFAVTWVQQMSVPVALDYDTNTKMLPSDAKSIWRSTLSPHYLLTGVQGLNQWYADATMRIERTSDQAVSLNREDPSLDFGWRRELETGQVGIRLHYDEASSRVSQLDETGRSGSDNSRVSKSVTVDWQKQLSEKLSFSLSAETKKMTFDGGASPDSKSHSANATLSYLWSERIEPYLQAAVNRYQPEGGASATNFYSLVAGLKWKIDDRLEAHFNGGANKISSSVQDNGWQAGADFTYQAEKSSFTAGLVRSLKPSGNGGFIESDQLNGGWSYMLSDRSKAGLDAGMRKNHGGNQSETKRFTAWYSRELTPIWNLRASILHKTSNNASQDAGGNVLGLSLVYSPPDF